MASGLTRQTSRFRTLTSSLTLASGFAKHTSLFRSLTGSLAFTGSQAKLYGKNLTASLSMSSGLARQSSLFKSLGSSLSLATSQVKGYTRGLTGSLGFASSQTGVRGTANVHTFYLGSSSVGSCSGKCENLSSSAGSTDTTTSQFISNVAGKYKVEPDIGSSTTTGTPSTSSVSGYAWVDNNDRSVNIQAGTWTFDLTITASSVQGNPVGNLWITVWNCQTNSLGSCTLLFKNWDNSTNVLGSTSPTKYTFTTSAVGPFSNIHFLTIEYWISVTTPGSGNSNLVATETTVSAASDAFTPGWNYARGLSGSLTVASSFAEKSS